MKGYRTVLYGLLMALVPAGLTYLAGVDWTQYVSPTVAFMVSGFIAVVLRSVTTGPIGSKIG